VTFLEQKDAIESQCRYCHYWHDDIIDEESGLKWAPFCDLFHGNGLAYPCDQFITGEEYLSLIQALKDASKHPSVKFDILDGSEKSG